MKNYSPFILAIAVPLIYKKGQSQVNTCNWPEDQNDAIQLFMDK